MSGPLARPSLHLTCDRGWMNDPNGLVHLDGVLHAFFQHHPQAPAFGRMRWGHASTRDLLTWTEHPSALVPGGEDGTRDGDAGGCWSGCAAVLPGGARAVVYTGLADGPDPATGAGPPSATARRAVALDEDLLAWRADPDPVVGAWPALDPPLTDWRDHALLALPGGGWRMVVAAGTAGRDGAGRLLSYRSTDDAAGRDLRGWAFEGVLLEAAAAGLDAHVLECPDLSAPPGAAAGELLVVLSWYRTGERAAQGALWLTGRVHAAPGPGGGPRFAPARRGALDLGDRFYAPQSCDAPGPGGLRRLALGWLRTQADPAAAGQPRVGALSLPRDWSLRGGRLHQAFAAEVLGRAGPVLAGSAGSAESAESADGAAAELVLPAPARALLLEVEADGPAALAAGAVDLVGPGGRRARVPLAAFGAASDEVLVGGAWRPVAPAARRAVVVVDAGLVEVASDDGRTAATSDLALASVAAVAVGGPVRVRVRGLTAAGPVGVGASPLTGLPTTSGGRVVTSEDVRSLEGG